ncbi:O-antigen ligase family protein [Salinimicrobium sp. CDJ15-81-2]|nr:O-antigen ligase family protein [Salinimicrobium nanhaiense]
MKKIVIRDVVFTYFIFLVPLSFFFIYMKSMVWNGSSQSEIFMSLRSYYLSIALQLGILLIILNYYRYNIFLQITVFLLILASSARGALIFVIVVLSMMNIHKPVYIGKRNRFFRPLLLLFFSSITFFGMTFSDKFLNFFSTTAERFSSLSYLDESVMERFNMYKFALHQPFDSTNVLLFGNGFGSFGFLYHGIDYKAYPHNVFLEIFFELGLVGLFIFLLFSINVFSKSLRNKNVFNFILIFVFLEALKSSSISDLWVLFGIIGCICRSFQPIFPSTHLPERTTPFTLA